MTRARRVGRGVPLALSTRVHKITPGAAAALLLLTCARSGRADEAEPARSADVDAAPDAKPHGAARGDFGLQSLVIIEHPSGAWRSGGNQLGCTWGGLTLTLVFPMFHYGLRHVAVSVPLGVKVAPMFWLHRRTSRYFSPYVEAGAGLGGTHDGVMGEAWIGAGVELGIPTYHKHMQLFFQFGTRYAASSLDPGQHGVFAVGVRFLDLRSNFRP